MPRPMRQLVDQGCYHVIARGNNRQVLFVDEKAFRYFLFLMARAKTRYPAKLYHYCLMPNHIHLLLEIGQGPHLPKAMQFLLQGYARWYGKRHTYSGHVWQGRYKSPLIQRESYYLEAGRYIERNPRRAGLVEDLRDYPWSSYRLYAYGHPDPLVDEDLYYHALGATPRERQLAYRNFVRLESPYATVLDEELVRSPC